MTESEEEIELVKLAAGFYNRASYKIKSLLKKFNLKFGAKAELFEQLLAI